MAENLLRSALATERFVFSTELVLGRDHSVPEAEAFVREAAEEPQGVKVISLTDLPGGNPALPPDAFVSYVLDRGLTPIAHLSGKDGNRNFLEGRLYGLARHGVENLLALTGDGHRASLDGKPKPVYDLDSVLILHLVHDLTQGLPPKPGPKAQESAPIQFMAGAVVNPYKVREPDQMMQYYKLELKIATGARFVITQLGFNLRKLNEVRQYMAREGLGHIPVIANVYVPTLTVAKMMQAGEIAGCVATDELIQRLEKENKPQRLERAALMVAAVRDLGFAGAHVGGFGLTHKDVLHIMNRSLEIGPNWRCRRDELIFEYPGQFYLFPLGSDGLSDGEGAYQLATISHHRSWKQRLSQGLHGLLAAEGSRGARFLSRRLTPNGLSPEGKPWRRGLRYRLLGLGNMYRRGFWGCLMCGDCIQDHLNYPGCTVALCYKDLRNGPCGGSRVDGSCEVDASRPCVWNQVYLNTLAAKDEPRKFAQTLVPPRDWSLNHTNALTNRLVGLDNYRKRSKFRDPGRTSGEGQRGAVHSN